MTIKALNPIAPFWYTPRREEGDPHPTRFKIKGLNGTEHGYIVPELIIDPIGRNISDIGGRGIELALAYGLTDWENFANGAGPVAFNPANFGVLDHALRVELAWKIITASHVQPEEKKT